MMDMRKIILFLTGGMVLIFLVAELVPEGLRGSVLVIGGFWLGWMLSVYEAKQPPTKARR